MHDRQSDAELVRSHLVALRGGAPFMSPSDSRLLLGWLDAGVPVPLILHGLEQAAEKRRSKRLKTPLRLSNAKPWVGEWRTGQVAAPAPKPSNALGPWIAELRSLGPVERWAADRLERLSGDDVAQDALKVVTAALEWAWGQADRTGLLTQAEAELEHIRGVVPEARWLSLREEVARDLLRQAHPRLSTQAVWDTVGA